MAKRGKLQIIYDILKVVQKHRNSVKLTPLLRQSNISSSRFKEYYCELLQKNFIMEIVSSNEKFVSLAEKGTRFLEKYQTIINFIDEFEL
jgi:predicted transcriptional regulator